MRRSSFFHSARRKGIRDRRRLGELIHQFQQEPAAAATGGRGRLLLASRMPVTYSSRFAELELDFKTYLEFTCHVNRS